jgi:very-short-patch-repair endonuclease
VPIGPFIADFACFEAKLVIEVDGGQHSGSARDVRRDQWLSANSFKTLRFWNNEVLQNLDGVLQRVVEAVATPHPARAARGHPSPTGGEGKKRVAR